MLLPAMLITVTPAQEDSSSIPLTKPDSLNESADMVPDTGSGQSDLEPVPSPTQSATGPAKEQPEIQVESKKSIFVPQIEQQQQAKKEIVFPQDPRLSAFLSVTFPGLGQLYQGKYLKALLFTSTFLVSSVIIIHYNNENQRRNAVTVQYTDKNGDVGEMKMPIEDYRESELNTSEKVINVSAFVVVGVAYFWSVIDAYRSAKAFNRKHFFAGTESSGNLSLLPLIQPDVQGLSVLLDF
jgi:hypothetical protein